MAKKPSEILKDYSKAVQVVDPSKFDFLVDEVPRIIRVRTRLGKGVVGGSLVKLDSLSENYQKFRKKFKGLSGLTTAKRSNLTLTGQMLDSIKGARIGYKFIFFFNNTESDNKAKWAAEGGRPFFELSDSEKNGLFRKVQKILRDEIRSIFK
jgi:hypothetical protein